MGNFRVVIEAVGGHGQHRHLGNGETVQDWPEGTPEAIIAEAVKELRNKGCSIAEATFHHWPNADQQVLDNLLTGKRTGSF